MEGKAADYHGWLECMIRVIKMSRYLDAFCQSEAYTKRPKSCPFLFLVRQAKRAQEKTPGERFLVILFYFILFYFILLRFISFHFISFHFISFHFISFYFILFYFIL